MKAFSRYRWIVVAIIMGFMLLHQIDRLLIGSMAKQISEEFNINDAEFGKIVSGALVVAAICYPIWGYLYDRYARAKLLALASFIWGATTWLSALARTYPTFRMARATTGIDDSSYPGIFSLIADYFGPTLRGKIYGLLYLTQPLGFLVGMGLGLIVSGLMGWRNIFYLTGAMGIVIAVLIFFFVKEPKRGMSEPELEDMQEISTFKFDWQTARDLFKNRTLRMLYIQGFFGVFPWNAITYFFILYMQRERQYEDMTIYIMMGIAVMVLAAGYPIAGALGDYLFKLNPKGRLIVAMTGVIIGAVMMIITLSIPRDNQLLFAISLTVNAFFIPFATANVISSVYDVTLPEVRSTALSIQSIIESAGAAFVPWIVGEISIRYDLKTAFLIICPIAWFLGFIFFNVAARYIPGDIQTLRSIMRERADHERMIQDEQMVGD